MAVLAAGALLTGALASVAARVHDRHEDELLDQQVREAAAVLQASIPGVQTPLLAATSLAAETGGDEGAFERLMARFVGRDRPFVTATLWRVGGTAPARLAVVGEPPLAAGRPAGDVEEFVAAAGTAGGLAVRDLLAAGTPRLGYAVGSPAPSGGYVVYAEAGLPADRTAAVRDGQAFAETDYALYLGPAPVADRLLFASTPGLPLTGRTAETAIPFGDTALLLVMRPREALGGVLSAWLPWVVLGVGLAVTALAGLATEHLLRRRRQAEDLARELAALAAERAARYHEQRSVAETLQQSLLPELPEVDGLELRARYLAGEEGIDVGGDWYDAVDLGDGRALLVIGDVSGRGLEAATVMASLRHAIRAYAAEGHGPAAVLARVAGLVGVSRDGQFATVLCASVDLGRRELVVASAGHVPPLLVTGRTAAFVAHDPDPPIGVHAGGAFGSTTAPLPADGTLLLFTDGLVERRGEVIDDGLARLRDLLAGAPRALDATLDRVLAALVDPSASDDTAVLAARWGAHGDPAGDGAGTARRGDAGPGVASGAAPGAAVAQPGGALP